MNQGTISEDYEMLAWEMQQLVNFIKDLDITDDEIYRIIYNPESRQELSNYILGEENE